MTREFRFILYASFEHEETKELTLKDICDSFEVEIVSQAELDFKLNITEDISSFGNPVEVAEDLLSHFENTNAQGYLDVLKHITSYRLEEENE